MSKVLRWMGVVAVLLIPALGHAAEECNGFINISYPGSQPINSIGDVLTVRVDLGAGTITGGPLNVLLLQKMGFDLSCADPPGPTPNCASEGPVIAYDGDASIMTNCPGTLTSDNPGGGAAPSHITFTFAPIVSVPNGSPIPPGFCSFSFTETILAQSTNSTGVIEQVIGYDVAACDNGVLLSGGFQTGSVPVESPVTRRISRSTTPLTKTTRFGRPAVSLRDTFHRKTRSFTRVCERSVPACDSIRQSWSRTITEIP